MTFNIQTLFPRPTTVKAKNNYIYLVLNIVILIVIFGFTLMIPFFYFSGYVALTIFTFGNILIWAIIWKLNKQGHHALVTIIICISIYFSAVIKMLYLGWDAGFQYHLMAQMALILLYPNKNLKISIVFSSLILISFLILYFYFLGIDKPKTTFIILLHTYNAVISMLALTATTLFYRTNTLKLINKLHHTSSTDPLTGLFNRRRMNIELARYSNMIGRYDQSNSLILLDIDYFKKINDKYGHGGGDEILKQFSKLLEKGMRETDLLARWGGEEFLVLTPFTDLKNAAIAAEKLRTIIELHTFMLAGQEVRITITCGVAELQSPNTIENALKLADKLLYKGKENGRNQVVVQKS